MTDVKVDDDPSAKKGGLPRSGGGQSESGGRPRHEELGLGTRSWWIFSFNGTKQAPSCLAVYGYLAQWSKGLDWTGPVRDRFALDLVNRLISLTECPGLKR